MILEQNGPPERFGDEKTICKTTRPSYHAASNRLQYPPAKLIRHLAESLTSSHSIHHTQKCPVDGHRRHRFFPVTPGLTMPAQSAETLYAMERGGENW